MVIPIMAVSLIVVSQNSISPYRLTLNILKAIGNRGKTDNHTARLTPGVHNDIMLAIAMNLLGKATENLP